MLSLSWKEHNHFRFALKNDDVLEGSEDCWRWIPNFGQPNLRIKWGYTVLGGCFVTKVRLPWLEKVALSKRGTVLDVRGEAEEEVVQQEEAVEVDLVVSLVGDELVLRFLQQIELVQEQVPVSFGPLC